MNMNIEAKTLFELLDDDARKLNREWVTFQELYSKSDDTVKLLGETAPGFFSILRNLLVESIFLTICRLTDPQQTFGKDNLSIDQLISKINDVELETKLSAINDEIREMRNPVKIWRDKQISHTDMETKLSPEDNPLPKISFNELNSIISGINGFMNVLWYEINNSQTAYSSYIVTGGAENLIGFLQLGKNFSEIQFELNDLVFQLHKKLKQLD
jgi:hypothetical protein